MMLRIQKERLGERDTIDVEGFVRNFSLTRQRAHRLPEHSIVMHPGPMNRGVEIESEVADSAKSVILEQVRNGVAVRMAVLYEVWGDKS